jgi:hypothetical protein
LHSCWIGRTKQALDFDAGGSEYFGQDALGRAKRRRARWEDFVEGVHACARADRKDVQ